MKCVKRFIQEIQQGIKDDEDFEGILMARRVIRARHERYQNVDLDYLIAIDTLVDVYNKYQDMDKVVEQMALLHTFGGESESAAKSVLFYIPISRREKYVKKLEDLLSKNDQF